MNQVAEGIYEDCTNGSNTDVETEKTVRDSNNKNILPVIRRKTIKKEDTLLIQDASKPVPEQGKKQIKDSSSLSDLVPYEFAIQLLEKYHLCHLSEADTLLWVFNEKCYEPLNDEKLGALIYQELPELIKLSSPSCEPKVKNIAEYIKNECHQKILKSNKESRYYHSFKLDDMRKVYGRVVMKNGVYDVAEDKMLKFDASLPYYYQVKAKFLMNTSNDKLDTPYFDKVLRDATGDDKDSIMMIHYALGMLLLPNKCKKFIVAGNASNSGKSLLFGKFLDRLLDPTRISRVDTSKLGSKFSLGGCEDKLLISCLDIDEAVLPSKAVGVIKRATGEEKVTTEAKYQSQKEVVVRFKFIFGTNLGFSSSKYDPGLVNRIIALPFIHETAEENQIPDLLEKLCKEKDKIVTKIMREMRDVIRDDGSIVIPESSLSIKLKNEWTTANTYFEEFCREAIEIVGGDDCVTKEELYEAYQRFFLIKKSGLPQKNKAEMLPKQVLIKNILEAFPGQVVEKRQRKFKNEEHKNPVRRITGIKLLI